MSNIDFERFNSSFEKIGLNKADLARMLSVKPNALQGWFERESVPSKYLYQLADALKVNPRYLLGETDDDSRMQIIYILGNASSVPTCMSIVEHDSSFKTIERHYFGECIYAVYQDTDSMKGTIDYGALCLCSPKSDIRDNDIVHYTYGDQNGIARYRLSADGMTTVLAPDNKDYPPLFVRWDSDIKLKMVRIIRTEQDL